MRPFFLAALAVVGCSLHAFNNDGGSINLAHSGDRIAVALGEGGIDLLDGAGTMVAHSAPRGASDSYDDVAIADGFVFALDADDGFVTMFNATDLSITGRETHVEVGPYSGIAAAAGRLVVSGGTHQATSFRYDVRASLTAGEAIIGYRGKPDVALDPAARAMFFSTHFSDDVDGQEFGLSIASAASGRFLGAVGLPGAGFTEGGGRPATFPIRCAVTPTHAFVAHGGGLSVVPYDARLVLAAPVTVDLGIQAVDVAVEGSTAWVVGVSPASLVEVDVTKPSQPTVRNRSPLTADPTAIVVTKSTIVIAAGSAGRILIAR